MHHGRVLAGSPVGAPVGAPVSVHAPARPVPARTRRGGSRSRLADGLVAVGLVVLGALSWYLCRGFTFVADEWDILAHHVHGDLLSPYNGHLSLVPAGIYQALAHTVGVGSYWPYLAVGLVGYLAVPAVFHLTHRRRVDPLLSALGALAIAWSWAASMNLMYGFLINFDLPLVLMLVAWWLIRRDTTGADWGAAAVLAVALASSSVGVVATVAVVMPLVVARAPLRRLARFAVPVVAWVAWWLVWHEPTTPASLGERAGYAWNMTVGILAGFTLGWKPGALVSLAVIVAVLVWAARADRIDAHVIGIGVAFGVFVLLSAFSRAGELALNPPDASRYVWLGDLLIVAALTWCARGLRLSARVLGAVALVVVIGAVGLVGNMRDYREFPLGERARTRAFLVGAEIAGPAADPDRILPLNMIPVTVGEYLELVATVGSPVAGVAPGDWGSPEARHAADALLVAELGLTPRVGRDVWCPAGTEPGAAGSGWVEVAPGGAVHLSTGADPARVVVRRLASPEDPVVLAEVAAHRQGLVHPPTDRSSLPWFVEVRGEGATLSRCEQTARSPTGVPDTN